MFRVLDKKCQTNSENARDFRNLALCEKFHFSNFHFIFSYFFNPVLTAGAAFCGAAGAPGAGEACGRGAPRRGADGPASTRLATTHHSFLGSFSAGSKRNFATKYAFFQVFRDLQNYLADLLKKLQNFEKKTITILVWHQ